MADGAKGRQCLELVFLFDDLILRVRETNRGRKTYRQTDKRSDRQMVTQKDGQTDRMMVRQ